MFDALAVVVWASVWAVSVSLARYLGGREADRRGREYVRRRVRGVRFCN
jgi:hypothetical protein